MKLELNEDEISIVLLPLTGDQKLLAAVVSAIEADGSGQTPESATLVRVILTILTVAPSGRDSPLLTIRNSTRLSA